MHACIRKWQTGIEIGIAIITDISFILIIVLWAATKFFRVQVTFWTLYRVSSLHHLLVYSLHTDKIPSQRRRMDHPGTNPLSDQQGFTPASLLPVVSQSGCKSVPHLQTPDCTWPCSTLACPHTYHVAKLASTSHMYSSFISIIVLTLEPSVCSPNWTFENPHDMTSLLEIYQLFKKLYLCS